MSRHGYTCPYELVGNPELAANPALMWGYFLSFAHTILALPQAHVYSTLLNDIIAHRDYFVVTTNVDTFFEKNGFDKDKVD